MMDAGAKEDLAAIRRIMEETRHEVVDRGKHFLIWGGISAVGLVVTWLDLTGRASLDSRWTWVALVGAGWVASMAVGWRDGRRAQVRTMGRRLLSAVWVATGITMTLVGMAGIFAQAVPPWILPGALSVVIAPATLVTAGLTGDRWLVWVAGAWWLGGGWMLFVPGTYTLLVMAGMSLLLLAAPGAVLYARSGRAPRPIGSVGGAG